MVDESHVEAPNSSNMAAKTGLLATILKVLIDKIPYAFQNSTGCRAKLDINLVGHYAATDVNFHRVTYWFLYTDTLSHRKPKTARSKRALAKREPLAHENTKVVLFLQGKTCSAFVKDLLSDINALKRPFTVRFTKKNDIHPFEDASSLEFFSQKNDASLLLFGSHSKKRPHCMTWVRCFGGQVLDMLELYVIKDTARTLAQFKGDKCKVGLKPLLSFSGTQFESPVSNQYTLAKSILTDFFRGGESATVDVEGLQYMISFAAGEDAQDGSMAKIHMRCWRIITKRSGQKVPRVELEEMGPRIDFSVGRTKEAEASVWKEAMKKAKGMEVSFRYPQYT